MMFFDSITLYFESLTRDGLRRPGYSKDGKFKEDQIVVGMYVILMEFLFL
ncbi:hypothetical protein ONA02_00050 [Mycoplasmopsis felis]|nr:hypothetical protein [Mycoplasmopsis felis]WAM02295.1 hypothetical protein ONA02_00050 [Mycoplasmopsis felis]